MKTFWFFLCLVFGLNTLFGQAHFQVMPGSYLVMEEGNLVVDDCHLDNEGQINQGAVTKICFTGGDDVQLDAGTSPIRYLKIQKASGSIVLLDHDLQIVDTLEFGADGNYLDIGTYDLKLEQLAKVTGFDDNDFILTSSSGQVWMDDLVQFTFPIGYEMNSPNWIKVINTGVQDKIGVRCLETAFENGDTGSSLSDAIEASWQVSEETLGGSNLSLELRWLNSDQPTGFDPNDCGMMLYRDGDWDLPVTDMQSASAGPGYHELSFSPDSFGIVSVGGAEMINSVKLAFRTFLQGPYTFQSMNDQLRTRNLIPLTEPYTGLGYTHQGRGGGETIDPAILIPSGDDAIVDWVVAELRDKNNPSSVLATKAALIQKDGDIVDLDGVSDLGIPVLDDQYYVAIRHRNHLGIRTPIAQSLREMVTTNYDFSSAANMAHGTNPMANLGGGIWGMYGGNTSGDGAVRATGPPVINDYSSLLNYLGGAIGIVNNVYAENDVNMDGTVRATGPPIINDYSRLLNVLGVPTNILFEQL